MARHSKRVVAVRAKVDRNKAYGLGDALSLVKENAIAKFDESIDVSVNLGVDAKKSWVNRLTATLPSAARRSRARDIVI